MKPITELFDRMDEWRHLPSYQLERRADLFFALYLPQALEAKLGFAIEPKLIPEFPVRKGTIDPHDPSNNRSDKIDYLALSQDAAKAVFVELKTDNTSRRPEQDEYLRAARQVGLSALLNAQIALFCASDKKQKYFCLLKHLADMGLVQIPNSLEEIMARPNLRGASAAAQQIKVTSLVKECHVVYVQPNGTGPNILSFQEFRAVVQTHDDPISTRFAQSLAEWARSDLAHTKRETRDE